MPDDPEGPAETDSLENGDSIELDRLTLAPLDPEDALRAMLATPPKDD